jgi:hypothetical protein
MSEQVEQKRFSPLAEISAKAYIKSYEQYKAMYEESINNRMVLDPVATEFVDWFKAPR